MAIERWARISVEVDVASEFRYREPIVEPGTLVIGITQSGETADTLAALRLARAQGATVLPVTNATGSQATREGDAVLFTRAGLEIGVAATKTFVAQVVLRYPLALHLARARGALPVRRVREPAVVGDRPARAGRGRSRRPRRARLIALAHDDAPLARVLERPVTVEHLTSGVTRSATSSSAR